MALDKLLLKNIFSLFSIQAVNYILPLLIIPLLVRVLGVELFGIYILIITVVQYFIIASEYGFNLTATRKIAINLSNKQRVSTFFFAVISAKLLIATLGFIALNVTLMLFPQYQKYILYLNYGYLSVIGSIFFPIWLYQAYEKMIWIAICNFISRMAGIVLVLLMVKSKDDLLLAIIIQSIMPIIAAAIALTYCFSSGMVQWTRISFKDVVEELKDSWDIFLSISFVSLYTTSIPLILGFFAGAGAVGVFSAADKIRIALQSVINPVSQAIYPRLSKLMIKEEESALKLIRIMFKFFVLPFFGFSLIIMLLSDELIYIFYGENLMAASGILQILIWIPPIVAIANLLGIQIMLPRGMKKQFSLTYILCGIIGLPLLFTGAYFFAAWGISIASIIIEIIVVSMFWYFITKSSNPFKLFDK
ncbi:oligosaccharide flippase family protein [Enterobacter asburiae]